MKKLLYLILVITFFSFSEFFSQAPVITDPEDQTVTEGQSATFEISVLSGTAPFAYQWEVEPTLSLA